MTDQPHPKPRRRIVYVAPDCTDSAVQKRAHGFVAAGHDVVSFSFRRARYNVQYQPDWPNVELGRTTERKLAARIMLCLKSVWAIVHHGRDWRQADLVYVRNLDLAVLALVGKRLTGCRAPLVYEVLDVHPALTGTGLRSRLLRWLERRVLNHSELLVVSSPAYLENYFQPVQQYYGRSFLLENKWPYECVAGQSRRLPYPAIGEPPCWTIGWFGNIRCRESLAILAELADALPDRVRVRIRGCISLLDESVLSDTLRGRENMVYEGPYVAPDELSTIYSNIHFNWCVDLCGHDNSMWLLPNRLYEGGYFGVPAVAITTHHAGQVVSQRQWGIAVGFPLASRLQEYLTALTAEAYLTLRGRVEAMSLLDFVDVGDIAKLMQSVPALGGMTGQDAGQAETAA